MRARLPSTLAPTLTALALTLTACGEAPAPAPAVAAPAPVVAPAPAPPVTPHGRVFLAASEAGLTPIACHLAHVPKYSSGADCLALAPVGSELRLESGERVKVTGTGMGDCGGTALVVAASSPDALRGHAVGPADASFVEVVPPTTPAEAAASAPDGLLARVAEVALADHPALKDTKGLQLLQLAQIDLDGDRQPEGLAAVMVPASEEDAPPAFAGLYLVPSAADARPRKLKGEPGSPLRYTVLGALDLDADGRPELWLNSYDDDGFAWSIEQVGTAALTELGRWRCEA